MLYSNDSFFFNIICFHLRWIIGIFFDTQEKQQCRWWSVFIFLIYAFRIEESAPVPIRRIIDKENDSPVPKYKRDLVQKLKILKLELQNLQPQGGHCRMEVSREEIFEVNCHCIEMLLMPTSFSLRFIVMVQCQGIRVFTDNLLCR